MRLAATVTIPACKVCRERASLDSTRVLPGYWYLVTQKDLTQPSKVGLEAHVRRHYQPLVNLRDTSPQTQIRAMERILGIFNTARDLQTPKPLQLTSPFQGSGLPVDVHVAMAAGQGVVGRGCQAWSALLLSLGLLYLPVVIFVVTLGGNKQKPISFGL